MSDYFEQVFYEEFHRTHAEKGDAELRAIVLTNAKKTLALPANPSGQMLAEAKKWQIESKVCNEILARRKEKKAEQEAAQENWTANAEKRAKERLLNLPTAASFVGQLIAAILEEEKLTADELAGWCDELAVLDRDELDSILEKLVAEQILAEKDGRYECINICTTTLYPENTVEWGKKKICAAVARRPGEAPERVLERAELILMALEISQAPRTAEGIREDLGLYSFLIEEGRFQESDIHIDEYDLDSVLKFMVGSKVLESHNIAGEQGYYIWQLGKVIRKVANIDEMIRSIREGMNQESLTGVAESNLGYMKKILSVLAENGEEMDLTDIMCASPELSGLSNQRVSALIRRLVDAGFVTRVEMKRKAYFVFGSQE